MDNNSTKEQRTITKVVTVRLFGIKIITLTTEIPPFGFNKCTEWY